MQPDPALTVLFCLALPIAVFGGGWLIGRAHRSFQGRSHLTHIEATRNAMLRQAAEYDRHHSARMGLTNGD